MAFRLTCSAGAYEAPTLARLVFVVLKHRVWHLLRGDGWVD